MKETSLEPNDTVKITDGSYAILLDKGSTFYSASIGLSKSVFVVEQVSCFSLVVNEKTNDSFIMHDIIIRDTDTGERYLHSSSFVKKVENYKPVSIGDAIIMGIDKYIFVSAGNRLVILIHQESGTRWTDSPIIVKDCYRISLEEFKLLIQGMGAIQNWEDVYKTLKKGVCN
jgi:hypothetical protein